MSAENTDKTEASELDGLGYEQARDQLIEVVRRLEAGGLSLEDSLALWEQGETLARVCERHLEGARKRIDDKLASVEDTANGTGAGDATEADGAALDTGGGNGTAG
ncbi:exodeoxyribonuclease VII small subunit [Haloechinothrix halophila]|uniref:exodeoxyribonuclease VII small subunit n=1 Tax=Haloechinothrix halophila TaxID=1069073 RepID=UPI000424972F|nr:exodeoxyribonuclease VII small subunit [Haloechinothrix halophila]